VDYEFFDDISNDLGQDNVPANIFPAIVRVMVEWVDTLTDAGCGPEHDLETAQCLADAIKKLADCQRRCIESALMTRGESQ
jgi:hypothetical protein